VAQAITCAKPSLLVPIPNQTEQAGNCAKAVKLGISLSVAQDDLSLAAFTQAMEAMKRGDFATSLEKPSGVANKFEARREIIQALSNGRP
jgi:UDP-N-acetylglucosamine:LPS N-acetylglucosamine transferase